MNNNLVLELNISDNSTLNELRDIYTIVKYIPWNEKEMIEIKRVHTIIVSRKRNAYDPLSFHRDITKMEISTPYPRKLSQPIPIPKRIKKHKY